MRSGHFAVVIAMLMQAGCGPAQTASNPDSNQDSPAAAAELEPVDEATLFEAAGFQREGDHWAKCGDPGTPSYEPGAIAQQGDFNGDGRPDAIVTEGGTYCFGNTGTGYTLVSQQADGSWKIIAEETGIPNLRETEGADGWPDIEIGGPGFCFPVHRWNGEAYDLDRLQYEGKPCTQEP